MKKKIIFRADGNNHTGLGHLYRLFALVEMMKDIYEIIFVTQSSSSIQVIPKEYSVILIDEGIELLEEPLWLSKKYDPTEYIIIADGYQFKSNYQKKIKEFGFSLIYIDDLQEYHMYADIIVNHSPAVLDSKYLAEDYTKFAVGTQYSLLRPSFLKAAKKNYQLKPINAAFVCFGGADTYNYSIKTTKALLEIAQIKKIHVVLGAAYKHDSIYELENEYPNKLEFHRNLSENKLLNLMKSCNFAVVPTSTIFYEISCLKIPAISGYFVSNQMSIYDWFNEQNCFYGIGDFSKFNFGDLQDILNVISENSVKEMYIKNQEKCVDGNQKERFLNLVASLDTSTHNNYS